VHALVGDVAVRSEHTRNGQMFRAHIGIGKVWRDWVEVDWDDCRVPNKSFIDLQASCQFFDQLRWSCRS
jgi:hypothetical protein